MYLIGYLLGAEDYYDHSRDYQVGKVSMFGKDFRNNTDPTKDYQGQYSLFAFVKRVENIIESHNASTVSNFLQICKFSVLSIWLTWRL